MTHSSVLLPQIFSVWLSREGANQSAAAASALRTPFHVCTRGMAVRLCFINHLVQTLGIEPATFTLPGKPLIAAGSLHDCRSLSLILRIINRQTDANIRLLLQLDGGQVHFYFSPPLPKSPERCHPDLRGEYLK